MPKQTEQILTETKEDFIDYAENQGLWKEYFPNMKNTMLEDTDRGNIVFWKWDAIIDAIQICVTCEDALLVEQKFNELQLLK